LNYKEAVWITKIMGSLLAAHPNKYDLSGTHKNHITEQGYVNADVEVRNALTVYNALIIQKIPAEACHCSTCKIIKLHEINNVLNVRMAPFIREPSFICTTWAGYKQCKYSGSLDVSSLCYGIVCLSYTASCYHISNCIPNYYSSKISL
jgi:hypothetical protein